MFDPEIERPIPLRDVGKVAWLQQALGKKITTGTARNYVTKGLNGVRLEAVFFGSKLCTSEARLKAFFQKVTVKRPIGKKRSSRSRRAVAHA